MIVDVGLMEFITIFVMTFALFLVIVGIFTAYFGSGKSRKIGAGLMVGGLILGVMWYIFATGKFIEDLQLFELNIWPFDLIILAIFIIVAAALGAAAALGIFLLSIMKS